MAMEIERKFRLPEGMQELGGGVLLGKGVSLGERREMSLRATYFDTPDLTLARAGVTLRRRTGGSDAGWHLKLPAGGDARREVGLPLEEGRSELQVPQALRDRVADVVGQAPLAPIAQLDTERAETNLTNADGTVLALLCEDAVTVRRSGQTQQWRELEVELADGSPAELETISTALEEAGAQPQPQVSKLVQALGDLLAERDDSPLTAAEVVGAYIAAQVGVVQAREQAVRQDAPDAVHKMRVATRRLRSTLRTFKTLMDPQRTEALLGQIKWLADMLGGPRDAEVLKARLTGALADVPQAAVVGPVSERLAHELDTRHAQAHASLVQALDSPQYVALMDDLVRLVSEPAFTEEAAQPATRALRRPLRKAGRKVTRLWEQAKLAEGEEQAELAHETRKKAKACRYAWEAVAPAYAQGKRAAAAWEEVTESLGTAQDTAVARERLLELAELAQQAGEPTFTYGVLYALELAHQDDAHSEADQAVWSAAKISKL